MKDVFEIEFRAQTAAVKTARPGLQCQAVDAAARKVISDAAPGTVHLGRPWHPSASPTAVASVVFRETYLAAAIADGTPFQVYLHPGESNGTLIGGNSYFGHYNPDSNTFTLSGPGLRPEDGVVIPVPGPSRLTLPAGLGGALR